MGAENGCSCKVPNRGSGEASQPTSTRPCLQTQPGRALPSELRLPTSLYLGLLFSLPCFLPKSSLAREGLAKQLRWANGLRARLSPPTPVHNRGIGVGGESWASGKALQCWASRTLWVPRPNSFEERRLGAKVSGNGAWGSRRPEFRAYRHHHARPPGFAATPCCPRTAAGPATLLHQEVLTARA